MDKIDVSVAVQKTDITLKTFLISLLVSTHYGNCFTMANVHLARYAEIIVMLLRPPPLQADISGIHS